MKRFDLYKSGSSSSVDKKHVTSKIHFAKGLSFNVERDGIRKKLMHRSFFSFVSMCLFVIFVLSIWIFGYPYFKNIKKSIISKNDSQEVTGQEEKLKDEGWKIKKGDAELNKNDYLKSYYYAVEKDDNFIVYRRDFESVDGQEVMKISNDQRNQFSNRLENNFWSSFSLSPDGHTIAYIVKDGLHLYDIGSGKDRIVIKKEREAMVNLGVPPKWSINGLELIYGISDPRWSLDGSFISLVQTEDNATSCGVLDTDNLTYHSPKTVTGEKLGCRNNIWGMENILMSPEYGEIGQRGLFMVYPEDFSKAIDLSEKSNSNGGDFYEARFSPDGNSSVFIYKENYDSEENVMGVADVSGNNFSIISRDGIKNSPFFSRDAKKAYSIEESEDGLVLAAYNIETKDRSVAIHLPKDLNYWEFYGWDEDRLVIIGKYYDPLEKTRNNNSRLLILNLENTKIDHYSSPFYNFLGFTK